MIPERMLFLTVEGVVVPRTLTRTRIAAADACRWSEYRHMTYLADMVEPIERLGVVLNSAWVPLLGMRTVTSILPHRLRDRVVGATTHGNRVIRRGQLCPAKGRRDYLDADVRRRQPRHLTVLECDACSVPIPLRNDAVIVPQGLWVATPDLWRELAYKLTTQTNS
ncbi:HAD domain-containing protein [Caballeronia grimmiae]|uniref:HAD domain-containing protein n=1 Tax=Caballeronia grimmiae TaxID=1071679 RepID=UPI0038B7F8E3